MSEWGNRRKGFRLVSAAEAKELVPGEQFGPYRVTAVLGPSRVGTVYAVERTDTGRESCLTVLGEEASNGQRERFQTLSSMEHPNLVQVGPLQEHDGRWFFSMESVRGADPLDYVRTGIVEDDGWPKRPRGRRAKESALITTSQYTRLREVARQLARGLLAMHRDGLIHRDVCPSNVLVTAEGRAVLMSIGGDTNEQVDVAGTAAYIAPERAASAASGAAADWYSLGVLIFEAISGRWPFDGPPILSLMQKQNEAAPFLRNLVADAPSDLVRLCRALLAQDPADRPSGDEILRVLEGQSAGAEELSEPDEEPFVGRHTEMGHLEQAFGDSRGRRPLALFLQGPAGAGKTRLVDQFLDRVAYERSDVVVFRGRCHEREHVAYKALDGVMSEVSSFLKRRDPREVADLLPADTPILARLFPVLRHIPVVARMPGRDGGVVDEVVQRQRAFCALTELLRNIAYRWPMVMFIDDLQWADPDSLALLSHALGPDAESGFLFVVTLRTDDASAVPPRVRDAADAMIYTRVLPIPKLENDDTVHLAHLLFHRIAGRHASAKLAQQVATRSGGNPLKLDELVRAAMHAPVGEGFDLDAARWERIQRLDVVARSLLEVVCVGAFPMRLETAAAAAGLAKDPWQPASALLKRENLVRLTGNRESDVIEPAHDRVRDTVLRGLDAARRKHVHRRIADELQAEGVAPRDPHLILQHLEAAGDRQRAAEVAMSAANLANEALAFDRAAQLYRTILRFRASEEGATEIRVALANALARAGRHAEAADAFLEVSDRATLSDSRAHQRRAAVHFLKSGRQQAGLELLESMAANEDAPSDAYAEAVRREFAERAGSGRILPEEEIAPAALGRVDASLLSASAAVLQAPERASAHAERALVLARRSGEPRRQVLGMALLAARVLCEGGRLGFAADRTTDVFRLAEALGDADLRTCALCLRGFEHYVHGRYQLAVHCLDQAELQGGVHGTLSLLAAPLVLVRVSALTHLGRLNDANELLSDAVAGFERAGDQLSIQFLRAATFRLRLWTDTPASVPEPLAGSGENGLSLTRWWRTVARAEAALYRGDALLLRDHDHELRVTERTKLMQISAVRMELLWLRGRIALASLAEGVDASRMASQVARCAKSLDKERVGLARVWAGFLRAGLVAARGGDAASALRKVRNLAEALDLKVMRAVACWLAATHSGDAASEEAAKRRLQDMGVKEPGRLLAVIAPGPLTQS